MIKQLLLLAWSVVDHLGGLLWKVGGKTYHFISCTPATRLYLILRGEENSTHLDAIANDNQVMTISDRKHLT